MLAGFIVASQLSSFLEFNEHLPTKQIMSVCRASRLTDNW